MEALYGTAVALAEGALFCSAANNIWQGAVATGFGQLCDLVSGGGGFAESDAGNALEQGCGTDGGLKFRLNGVLSEMTLSLLYYSTAVEYGFLTSKSEMRPELKVLR